MQDIDGAFSSKRLVTLAFTVLMLGMGIANTWFGHPLDHEFLDMVRDIVMTGLGTIGAEKFTQRGQGTGQ